MAYRKFIDRSGAAWQIRDDSRGRWAFEPLSGNEGPSFTVSSPTHTDDPYEVSDRELQRLFDGSSPDATGPKRPSPFKDL